MFGQLLFAKRRLELKNHCESKLVDAITRSTERRSTFNYNPPSWAVLRYTVCKNAAGLVFVAY